MSRKRVLRLIALAMLAIAVAFIACALANPALGSTIYIGPLEFGAEYWRICYAAYVVVMIGLFAASFFVKEKVDSEETMSSKSSRASFVLIACLAVALVVSFMRIGSLEREVDEIRSAYSAEVSALRGDMQSIYANVDAQLKQQASILSDVVWAFGELDPDALTASFEISVVPKVVSDATCVSVSVAGSTAELEREGDVFSGSFAVPLTFEGDGRPVVAVAEGGVRSTEVVEGVDVALLHEQYLPSIYAEDVSGQVRAQDGSIVFNTDIFIWCERVYEETAVFEEAAVVVAVDGSQVDRIDATANVVDVSHNGTDDGHYLPFDKSYPVPDGGELVITVIAVDSLGFTHAYEVGTYVPDGDELMCSAPVASEQIWAAPGEFEYAKGA